MPKAELTPDSPVITRFRGLAVVNNHMKVEAKTFLADMGYTDIRHFIDAATESDVTEMWRWINSQSLHAEPEKDEFKSESPIRAFTDWKVEGVYALGKGFRPSLAHLVPYLNAMETKEGWQLVQILEALTQHPSFVFRREPPMMVLQASSFDFPDVLKIGTGLRQVAGELSCYVRGDEVAVPYDDWLRIKGRVMPFVDRINGYALELGVDGRVAGFAEAAEKMDQAREASDAMDNADPTPPWMRHGSLAPIPDEHYMDAAEYVIGRLLNGTPKAKYLESAVRDFKKRFAPPKNHRQMSHRTFARQIEFVTSKPVERIRQLIDAYREEHRLRFRVPHTEGSSLFDTESLLPVLNDPDVIAKAFDDPINPKHYNGRACADIGERLSANGYQILKYCWRLDRKDESCQELGKAMWYLDSEMDLITSRGFRHYGSDGFKMVRPNLTGLKPEQTHKFLEDRIADRPKFTQDVARLLWGGYNPKTLSVVKGAITAEAIRRQCNGNWTAL